MAESGTYTEDTIARRRLAMAQALLGDRKQPIRHWAEGLDELAKGAFGGYQFGKADREEQNSKESDRKAMADLLGMPYVPKAQGKTGYDTISSLLSGGEQTPIAPLPPPAQMQAPVQQPALQPQVPQQQGQLPVEDQGQFNRLDMAAGGLPVEGGGFNRMDARAGDPQIQQALLGAISGAESPNYTTKFGGGQFNSFADHPRDAVPITTGPMAGQRSTAAGKYQFLAPTWDAKAKELGLSDFSPQNQDTAAWDLANQTYKQKTGGDLEADVKAGKIQQIAGALSGIWPSLPGGGQPNPATQGFGGRLASGMQDQAQIPPNATPAQGMQQSQAATPPPGAPTQQQAAPAGDRAPLNIPPNVSAFIQQAMGSNNPQMRAQAIALYQQYSSPEEYGFQNLPDGTILKTSKKTGAVSEAYSSANTPKFVESIGVDRFSNKIPGFVNMANQTVKPATMEGGKPVAGNNAPIDPNITGDEFLKSLEKPQADQIKAMVEGRMQPPGSFALKTPYWQQMLQLAAQYEPGFDMTKWGARASTAKDFASGKAAQNITSLNTVMGHFGDLRERAEQLGNSSFTPWNKVRNQGASTMGAPELKNFNIAANAVSDELARVFRQSGMSDHEIAQWRATIDSASSPEQFKGTFKTGMNLLRSRMDALADQYNRTMGGNKSGTDLLNDKARKTLDDLEKWSSGTGQEKVPQGERKNIDGKNYIKQNGQWYAE